MDVEEDGPGVEWPGLAPTGPAPDNEDEAARAMRRDKMLKALQKNEELSTKAEALERKEEQLKQEPKAVGKKGGVRGSV